MDKEALKSKLWWTWLGIKNNLFDLGQDLCNYYLSPYPFLLVRGSILRLIRRLRRIWLPPPKSPGRPPISEEVVDLILEPKSEKTLPKLFLLRQKSCLIKSSGPRFQILGAQDHTAIAI